MASKQLKNFNFGIYPTVIINIANGITSDLFSWIFKCQYSMEFKPVIKSQKFKKIFRLKRILWQLPQIKANNMKKNVKRQG